MLQPTSLLAPLYAPPVRTRANATTHIGALLERFAPIGLDQIDAVALQNRTDTKCLLGVVQLCDALRALAGQYRVLEVGGMRLSPYETLYFDTPDLALYLQHHAGKRNRVKIRSRRYVATNQSFLEVKRKTRRERTVKQRIALDHPARDAIPEMAALLDGAGVDATALQPSLWNAFSRITLASVTYAERLTIDLNLRFAVEGRIASLPGVAVVEVKQDGVDRDTPFMRWMHAAHNRPTGFSKYCIGIALLVPSVKHNSFKPKLRLVQPLLENHDNDY